MQYLQPRPDDFDERREEGVEVHREVQLKLNVVVPELGLQLLEVFVERAARKE
jgi:hypothetical protein